MKFLSILSNALFAYSAAASVVSRSIEASQDVSDGVPYPPHLVPRVENTAAYSKVFAAHTGITKGKKYAFSLTWANNDGGYLSEELKAYCLKLGFKHKAILVGYVSGSERNGMSFLGKTYDLLKNAEDKGISVDKYGRDWKPGHEDITFLGEIKSSLTDREISALGQELITGKHYTPDEYDCSIFADDLFSRIRA